MTSNNPMGPWELKTTFLTNPSIMFEGTPYTNNHHAMFEFRGRQYIAYHSVKLQTTRGLTYGPGDNYRSTHIDRIALNNDGTLADVPGSLEGPAQVGKHDPYSLTEAETIGAQAGITTDTVQGAIAVTEINSGDWLGLYKVDFGSTGAAKFTARVTRPPSGLGKGVIQIREDSTTGKVIGYLVIDSGTGGGWEEIAANLMWRAKGVHDLFFVFYGQNWNFDRWQFSK
jgi:arabinoxylan arabinofuranohydrolase